MQVGVNYPWRDYGWDFGLAPPGWRAAGAPPRWAADIDAHVEHFHSLGIDVVRWFLLGDGLTYGTESFAPIEGPDTGWQFEPCPPSPELLQHFERLLQHFARAAARGVNITLLPVLVDFHFCNPGTRVAEGWIKGGRADALADRLKQREFLDAALEPLLEVGSRYPETIYAWEVMNEPEWVTYGWDPHLWRTPPVDEPSMVRFLEEGCDRIRRAGFRPTVGFALRETLFASGIVTEVNQFHHYPGGRRSLDGVAEGAPYLTILGEFATATSDAWPELPEWDQGVLNRLRTAGEQGYTLAMPWSFLAKDRHTAWSADVERDIGSFTGRAQRAV
jgi:hypothetical protein